ncbi:MAG: DeoR/GlpR transcriptional regulator [Bacteroidales bacterium]|nr:DeoR/GlpR transcriptional regulator [Bacteroidales bacterium]
MDIYDSAQGRRSAILQLLKSDSSVNVTELSNRFGVSEVTIRKDLRILKERKLLVRVHGGAILGATSASEPAAEERHLSFKKMVNMREKEAIGRAAAKYIRNGDTILVDSGTTALEVVKNLQPFDDLTIITNSISAMAEALKYKRFNVILLGGTVRESSMSMVGPLAESNLKLFYCDKLFLGVDSFSVETGLSTPSVDEASTNQVMISRAREVIGVFDSSKVNKRALAFIAEVDKINTVVTDNNLPSNVKRQLKSMNINVETVIP